MKNRLLIVEDDAIARDGLKLTLEIEGYDILTAMNGKQAIELLEKSRFDLVLSDIVMSEMTGIDLLLQIKKRWPETIVILITGFGSLDSVIQALRLGAYDYLLKPCSDDELKIRIRRGLERRRMGQLIKEKNRQDAVFELVVGLADTLNNLLAGISGNHEMLSTYFVQDKDPDVVESFRNASQCINKAARIVDNLCMTVSLFKRNEIRPFDLNEAFLSVKMQFDADNLDLHIPDKLPWINGGERLAITFINLAQNALDAMPPNQKVKISARIDPTGEFVEVIFEDTGVGIEPDALTKVFIPFFTTKPTGHAGLGLWMAYQTVTFFGGSINISSLVNQGTIVTVRLPIYREEARHFTSIYPA
ncbi:response regulator [candidate division KSB1 bacterium]|nr:response regulator [candidate division KSB1 bacterium]